MVQAHNAKKLHGQAKVDELNLAIARILEVLDICLEAANRPRYDFLVYNASVYFWNVSRPLMRAGVASYVVESMEKVVGALEEVKDADVEWRM